MRNGKGLLVILRAVVPAIVGLMMLLLAPVFVVAGLIIRGWEGLLCALLAPVLAIVGPVIAVRSAFPVSVEHDPDGRPRGRGEHYHGDKQGTWTFWYASGQTESQGDFVGGWESGAWTFWHPNGQMKARGEIGDDGRKRGPWHYWDSEGHALTEEEYQARYPRSDREPMRN
jgi:hypothetical protein